MPCLSRTCSVLFMLFLFFFFKQKTAYEIKECDWSSDVCSSDLKWHLDGTDYFGDGRCPDGWDSEYWFDMRCFLEEMTPEMRTLSRDLNTADKIHEHNITEDFKIGRASCRERV